MQFVNVLTSLFIPMERYRLLHIDSISNLKLMFMGKGSLVCYVAILFCKELLGFHLKALLMYIVFLRS